jgi:hypothetical protein
MGTTPSDLHWQRCRESARGGKGFIAFPKDAEAGNGASDARGAAGAEDGTLSHTPNG